MSFLLALLLVAVVAAAFGGPTALRRITRRGRSAPRLELAIWLGGAGGWVFAAVALGLAATAELTGGSGLAALLHACREAVLTIIGLRDITRLPAAISLLFAVGMLLRLAAVTVGYARRIHIARAEHRRSLLAEGAPIVHRGQPILVVDRPVPAAYCLPGGRPRIVVSSAALTALSAAELGAVVAHELAHLRGRHHLLRASAEVLAEAFPFVPLLRATRGEVGRLLELAADERAGTVHGRRTVARAIFAMSSPEREPVRQPDREPQPELVPLAASGGRVVERVSRLTRAGTSGRRSWSAVLALATVVAVTGIAAAVLVPAVTADPKPICSGQLSERSHGNPAPTR